jgi:hypothetical protein
MWAQHFTFLSPPVGRSAGFAKGTRIEDVIVQFRLPSPRSLATPSIVAQRVAHSGRGDLASRHLNKGAGYLRKSGKTQFRANPHKAHLVSLGRAILGMVKKGCVPSMTSRMKRSGVR